MLVAEGVGEVASGAEVVAVGVPVVAGDGGTELFVELDRLEALDRVGPGTRTSVADLLAPGRFDPGWLRSQGFTGMPGQSLVLRTAAGPPSVVLLGLGRVEDLVPEQWRRAGAALARAAGAGAAAALVVPSGRFLAARLGSGGSPNGHSGTGATGRSGGLDPEIEIGAAVAEGAALASYRFDQYRSAPGPDGVSRLLVLGGDVLASGVRRGATAAAAVGLARDLINTPPSDLTPRQLAARVTDALNGLPGTSVEVWDEDRIASERLGGLQGVSRGSSEPPRLVVATFEPNTDGPAAPIPHIALVGKGITFDSGGLSLKTADGMTTMKTDMSGAAIVVAAISACARLGLRAKVTALAPMSENMPGGAAMKPGDVLTIRNGSTIEVLNTDAEGRLVLADALSLAAELRPDAIIDVATLTGAARIALGSGVGALFGNQEALVERVRRAGARAGERLWPMPLPADYGEHIDSDVADMKNIGRSGQAGAIAAAHLLARFVGNVPWAHLDIAGTGRSTESSGYLTKGGTGFGVRTLLALLDDYASNAGRAEPHSADS